MGYTHYWKLNASTVDENEWKIAIRDCQKMVEQAPCAIDRECDDEERFALNGVEDEQYETFVIPRTPRDIRFAFCKTNQKDYDLVVTACLTRLYEAGLAVTSDGEMGDWELGIAHAETVLGRPMRLRDDFLGGPSRRRSESWEALKRADGTLVSPASQIGWGR